MEGAAKSEGDYEKIGESEEMIPGGMDRATPEGVSTAGGLEAGSSLAGNCSS